MLEEKIDSRRQHAAILTQAGNLDDERMKPMTWWWFQISLIFTPTWGNDPNLTIYILLFFIMG